jgi:RNA polymerase-binding transcription factor DksA
MAKKSASKKNTKKAPAKAKVKAKPAAKKSSAQPAKKAKPVKAKAKPVAKAKPKTAAKKPVVKVEVRVKPRAKSAAQRRKIAKEIIARSKAAMQGNNHKPISKIPSSLPIMKEQVKKPIVQQVLPEEANRKRYSDKELEEFRKIINQKIDDAKRELANLTQQMTNANEHGTDDTAGSFKMLEDGSETVMKEEAGQLATRQRKFIEQLENALIRIENKTYGICRVTGKLIPKARLRAVPHTTQSIEAKMNQYRD